MAQVEWGVHTRSVVVVGSAELYVALAHVVVMVAHASSLETVAAAVRYSRPVQGVTPVHAAALVVVLKCVPLVQPVQVRSTVVLPLASTFCPAVHVAHAVQATLSAIGLNDSVQVAQVRSEVSVIAATRPWPAPQKPDPTWHSLPSFTLLYVAPKLQAAHWRSNIAEGVLLWPSPAGQVSQATQASLPAIALKSPVAQSPHTRSDVRVNAAVSYLPAAQSLMVLHSRFDVAVGALDVY